MDDWEPGFREALHRARTGRGVERGRDVCTVCICIRYAAPGVVRTTLEGAVAGRLSARSLHRSLRAADVNISREAINVHRKMRHQP